MILIFNDNSTGNGNGYGNTVTNCIIPQHMLDTQQKYIEKLEEEVRNLKDEIQQLKTL